MTKELANALDNLAAIIKRENLLDGLAGLVFIDEEKGYNISYELYDEEKLKRVIKK